MSKLSKDTKQRIVISLTSEFSGKELIDAIENAGAGSGDEYALADLSNIAGTAIPAGVNLESSSIDQSALTAFALRTKDQTTSVSGRIIIRTGTSDSAFSSGGINIDSGTVTNAIGTLASTVMTGPVILSSGTISSGTRGSTGTAFLRSGGIANISSATTYSGNSGSVGVVSGTIQSSFNGATVTGNSGFASLQTGAIIATISGATANGTSGSISVSTGGINTFVAGAIVNGNSGPLSFTSGGVTGFGTSNSNTGTVSVFSGNITNTNNTGNTGSVSIFSGSNSGIGITGNINITTGSRAGDKPRGGIILNGQGVDLHLRNQDDTVSVDPNDNHSLFIIRNTSPSEGGGQIQFLTYAQGNNTMGMRIFDSSPASGFSIKGWGRPNENGGPFNFISTGASVLQNGTYNGGDFNINANSTDWIDPALGLNASANSGNINISTANGYIVGTNTDANSGDINIFTGNAQGTGTRGSVLLDGRVVSADVDVHFKVTNPGSASEVHIGNTSYGQLGGPFLYCPNVAQDRIFEIGSNGPFNESCGLTQIHSSDIIANIDGSYVSGDIDIKTKGHSGTNPTNASYSTGNVNIYSDDAITYGTGFPDANTGNVNISTGTPQGSGTRGFISLDGDYVTASSTQIKDVADATDPNDAVNKGQLDSGISAKVRSGVVDIPNASNIVTVTFSSDIGTSNYSLSYSVLNFADISPLFLDKMTIAKSSTGFTVKFSQNTDSINYKLEYVAQLFN